ncbi:heme-degrading domain-containing protein [Streptomyces sp. PLAI1-29]|uniref:UPF0303 protein HCK00_15385 n=1 Tax=Streptomyces zingiberis TaxID=2053010 RepID=A0ABX1BZW8_9ACTN|nr:heme-degrading domain-containing protein [Streptomyces zingiberis]
MTDPAVGPPDLPAGHPFDDDPDTFLDDLPADHPADDPADDLAAPSPAGPDPTPATFSPAFDPAFDPAALIEVLRAQEERLVLRRFSHDDAWRLGCLLVEAARARRAPVAVDIRRNGQQLFHCALPGSTPDNDDWIDRKRRVVERFGESSYLVGTRFRARGTTFENASPLDGTLYAAHGGSFPIAVEGAGVIGTVTVSGLQQAEDHALVVKTLERFLSPDPPPTPPAAPPFRDAPPGVTEPAGPRVAATEPGAPAPPAPGVAAVPQGPPHGSPPVPPRVQPQVPPPGSAQGPAQGPARGPAQAAGSSGLPVVPPPGASPGGAWASRGPQRPPAMP